MAVVINELEHIATPSATGSPMPTAASAGRSSDGDGKLMAARIAELMVREAGRRARLWAD